MYLPFSPPSSLCLVPFHCLVLSVFVFFPSRGKILSYIFWCWYVFVKCQQIAYGSYDSTLDFRVACLTVPNRQLPAFRYTEEMVPWHPCLRLISNCEQKLSSHTARRLITMEKVKEFEVSF